MAFSLFGKKQPEPQKPAAKPAARQPAPKPAVAPKPGAPPAARQTPPPAGADEEELISLDFTAPGALPPAELHIGVEEHHVFVPPTIERVAMLFANGENDEACKVLEPALKSEDFGEMNERAWGMLFDLYQLLGRREPYEALALDYAAKFEKSPPAWIEASAVRSRGALATGGKAFVSLSGSLGAKAAEALKQLTRIAEKNPVVRLDVAKVKDADDEGATLLLDTLRAIKKAKKECIFGGAEPFAALLAKKIVVGERSHEAMWLLLLELYQQQYQQEAFEDAAVNYAVTFEVSPPSWEAPKAGKKPAAPVEAEPVAEGEGEGFELAGEVLGGGGDTFALLNAYAEKHPQVLIDARRLARMDFISAGEFLNTLARLTAGGKQIRVRNSSCLMASLWQVLGVHQFAQIETRKN